MKLLFFTAAFAVASAATLARAQDSTQVVDSLSPNDVVNPTTAVVEGAGIKVGDGTVLHPTVGLETGVVSNVFYQDANTNASGLLRILVELQTGSLSAERLAVHDQNATDAAQQQMEQGSFAYHFGAYASWDQYLSTNDAVSSQSGLGGGLLFRGVGNPQHTLSVPFTEQFNRLIRPTNFESSSQTNRDVNSAMIALQYAPAGRTLSGRLYYRNEIDYFESDRQHFANRFHNIFGATINYQWLPLTRVYLEGNVGYFTGLGSASTKIDAVPVQIYTGIMTSLTLNTTINARIGYSAGGYSSGPSYSTVMGGIQLGYRYSPLGRVTLMYDYDHVDSINANFYRDHQFKVLVDQQFAPFVVLASAELHFREYEGITNVTGIVGNMAVRDDVIGAVTAGGRYLFRGWLAGTVDYQFASVNTDFRYDVGKGMMDDPSYTRHQLLLGVRAAY
jgi:hypothetical protein